ncbi:hypothetical protein GCM10027019_26490 [Melaminivora jejuensis]|uniref:hypothetical protein n=1 Tax=Melaminivora jejuensis TaxID=1267217 RepID=UPI001AE053D6|nr:hypothetical protein [Melaminivora jejuensis]UHJ66357.1 hypothetical protein LVC68_07580 [Melaminivora jejuensis]
MDRGIKDEGFVRHALDIAKNEDGRWIANQSCFNGSADSELQPAVHAALVTSVSIYVERYKWDQEEIKNALQAKTVGQARALVDRLSGSIPRGETQA